jgi:phage tail sheath protein FI
MSQINESAIKTPGVYVNEIPSFPPSIAQVATAIPAFIGYTEQAIDANGNSLTLIPTRITSLLEYQQYFGGAPSEKNLSINITETQTGTPAVVSSEVITGVTYTSLTKYMMFYALQMYFMNGGGDCYIVSVSNYLASGAVLESDLSAGLDKIEPEDEPTLLVFPDGQGVCDKNSPYPLDQTAYYTLQNASLALCAKLQDRFALIDIFDNSGDTATNASGFRNGIGTTNLNYGAAYYPNLVTALNYNYNDGDVALNVTVVPSSGTQILKSTNLSELQNENQSLYNQATAAIGLIWVEIAPSAVMAGVMAAVDGSRGVWKAPANVSLTGVQQLKDSITDDSQGNLNIDPATGKSINAIRAFTGKGILVWGARTLTGNDNDFRYISVRRFFIMVEESVKLATMQFVFEPNVASTWTKVRAMIENYLTNLWRQGALAGAKPEQAFYVSVGLGQTMIFDDILNGKMIVEIGLAPVRPAEFIVLRFTQIQQTS